jgi:hypothetical protein
VHCKLQTRFLVREDALGRIIKYLSAEKKKSKIKSGQGSQREARYPDELVDWLSAARTPTPTPLICLNICIFPYRCWATAGQKRYCGNEYTHGGRRVYGSIVFCESSSYQRKVAPSVLSRTLTEMFFILQVFMTTFVMSSSYI